MKRINDLQMMEIEGGDPAEYWSCVLYFAGMGTVIGMGNPLAGFVTSLIGAYACGQIDY